MAILSKDVLYDMYVATELGGKEYKAYEISKAPNKSGYSFGQCQWDLLGNPGTAAGEPRYVFQDILKTATDSGGNRILSDEEVGTIMDEVKKRDGNISSYKDKIDLALCSNYGVTKIDEAYDGYLDKKLTRLNNLISEVENSGEKGLAVANYIRDNEIMQMLLLDYDNQFPGKYGGIDGINSPGNVTTRDDGALMKFLKNGEATLNGKPIKVDGEFDIVDYLNYLYNTKQANRYNEKEKYSGAVDLLRRFAKIIDLADVQFDLTEEERKFVNGLLGLLSLKISRKELHSKIHQYITQAIGGGEKITRRDPLIVDLDNDGIETIGVTDGAYFDHDRNGFAEQTGWASSDDGLLVMDRNNDGIINDGKELFGDQTILSNGQRASNGFQALAELDSNADGKIDANDLAFSQLKVWQDVDGDGYSASDELLTLEEAGIQSINLNSTPSTTTDPEGNTQTRIGSFEKLDGTTGTIGEYTLRRDTAYTIANEWLDVPEDIAALPDLQGYGNVYDLQQAMVRDTSGQLKSLIEQFISATDINTRNTLMEQILFKWTGSDGISSTSRGANIDARRLAVLEKFFGQPFVASYGTNPTINSAILLKEAYRGLSEMMYSQLMAQTHLKDLYGKINYTWDEGTQKVAA